MSTIVHDIRFAFRSLRRSPGFAVVSVLTLCLGIGATTTIFSVVDGVLLRPLPYAQSENLVMVGATSLRVPGLAPANPMDFYDWRESNSTFSHLVAQDGYSFDLVDGDQPERIEGAAVTAGFFEMLGVLPVLGRGIGMEDDRPTAEPVVVINHDVWQRRFGGALDVLGRQIVTADRQYTIVGVMPQGFSHPEAFWSTGVEIWMPLSFIDGPLQSRGARYLQVMGRLAPEVTIHQARQDMDGIGSALAELYPENRDRMPLIEPLREETIGDVGEALGMLMGAVGLLLLIACVNVANLFLVRATSRQSEMALRSALGAGRGRMYRQLVTEGVVLSVLGGTLGMGLAFGAVQVFRALDPGNVPRAAEVVVDGRILLFSFIVSVITGILFSLVPAWRLSRTDVGTAMKSGSERGGERRERRGFRESLVILELSLAVVLVVGAGLFINSFARLQAVDPGFNPRALITATVSLNSAYEGAEQQNEFFRQLTDRLETIPGASAVTYASSMPLDGNRFLGGIVIEGREVGPVPETAEYSRVGPGFFAAMEIEVFSGREFGDLDDASHEPVMVVNEAFARRYWPGEEAVGMRVGTGRSGDNWATIVGVVRDINRVGLDRSAEPEIFFPLLQRASSFAIVAVRGSGDLAPIIEAIRTRTAEIDSRLPITIATMESAISSSISQPRFYALLLSSFAGIALLLAAVGVYGTMSYTVGQRQRELGIRMALGATGNGVLGMIVRQGVLLTGMGVAAGLIGAFAVSRVMENLLFGVSSTDAATYAVGSVSLSLVAIVACYVPARRASKSDPMLALRSE